MMSFTLDKDEKKELETIRREIISTGNVFRRMVKQAWDGVMLHHDKGVIYINREFRKMFNISAEKDIDDIQIHTLLAPETRHDFFLSVQKSKENPETVIIHSGKGLSTDGSLLDLEMSTLATVFSGQPTIVTVFRDVTEKIRMEEHLHQNERLTATGKLAFHIAHEINNPLGGIIAYSHLLLEDINDGVDPEDLTGTVNKIIKLANRCKVIVGSLLDFARHDPQEGEYVNINDIIEESLSLLSGHIIMNGITVEKDMLSRLPEIKVQKTKIEQVIINLIINAAEAMSGIGHLRLETTFLQKSNEVIFRITDTGPGIQEEDRKKLFDPFFTTKPRGRGVGLGLSISHGIIKQHGGRIEVDTYPGVGSEFSVFLPVNA